VLRGGVAGVKTTVAGGEERAVGRPRFCFIVALSEVLLALDREEEETGIAGATLATGAATAMAGALIEPEGEGASRLAAA
jgi:hypothetical protein